FFNFSLMSLSASRRARVASENALVCSVPAVPMRPKRTVTSVSETVISQNFREPPPMYSKRWAAGAEGDGAGGGWPGSTTSEGLDGLGSGKLPGAAALALVS